MSVHFRSSLLTHPSAFPGTTLQPGQVDPLLLEPELKVNWLERLGYLVHLPAVLWQNLKAGKKIQGIILLSALVHGVLAIIPLPKAVPEVNTAESAKAQVRIVQVPKKPRSRSTQRANQRPTAKPKAKPRVQRPARPKPARPKTAPKLTVPRPKPKPTPKPKPQPAPPAESKKSTAPPGKNGTPGKTPGQDGSPPSKPGNPTPPPAQDSSSWDDFPQYPNAQSGCFKLDSCRQTADPVARVAAFFSQQLPAKKYVVKPVEASADRQVFQVSRGGITQFLSILDNQGKAVYVVSDQPLTIDDLAGAVEVPAEVSSVLSNLDSREANASYFADPNLFYQAGGTKPKSGIGNISLVPNQKASEAMDAYFKPNLIRDGFDVNDLAKTYGGGPIYEVVKDGNRFYLNLVPSKDGANMLVVVWRSPPN